MMITTNEISPTVRRSLDYKKLREAAQMQKLLG